jgi:hypothetical protein
LNSHCESEAKVDSGLVKRIILILNHNSTRRWGHDRRRWSIMSARNARGPEEVHSANTFLSKRRSETVCFGEAWLANTQGNIAPISSLPTGLQRYDDSFSH